MAKLFARIVKLITPKRRWAQFSLATMFLIVTVLCVGLALVVVPAERQRGAVAAFEAVGGRVGYFGLDQKASAAFPMPYLRRWLPRDYFDDVRLVDLSVTQVTDAGLAHLQGLTRLERLWIDGTQVTDAGLAHLEGLTGLQWLSLEGTQLTDAGLAHLQRLTGLQRLHLRRTQVTDAGQAYLQGLTGLQQLYLNRAKVTDAGVAHLRQALPNCQIRRW